MDRETFRQFGHEMVDWIADYFKDVENYQVKSEVSPGDIRKKLPEAPPEQGENMEEIWQDFQDIILPGITHWQHPGWFGYFPANNSPASVLGELLSAGLGIQGMVWATSPAAEELEEVVLTWLRKMLGLPDNFRGVIQDTASTATLCSLLTAREAVTDYKSSSEGVPGDLRVYASRQAHSSVEKGVRLAGFGSKNLVQVENDSEYAMIPSKLREAIQRDRREGLKPACVVATAGTTSSAAIDPLKEIGEICTEEEIWLHVDGAYAGTAAILEEKKDMLAGVEHIDTFVFNPHKWMMTNFDCSAYFVKDPEALIKTMSADPEYLKTAQDDEVNNYRNWGIQLGRRFRALKLWFVLRDYGVQGLQEIIKNHIDLARDFGNWIKKSKNFELMAPVNLSLVCFRWNDASSSQEELDRKNQLLLKKINDSGEIFLTHTRLDGRYTIRFVVGQRTTEARHVRRAQEIIEREAEKL